MVRGELDRPLVERRKEGFGKSDFGHDVLLKGRVERGIDVGIQFGGCLEDVKSRMLCCKLS